MYLKDEVYRVSIEKAFFSMVREYRKERSKINNSNHITEMKKSKSALYE